jgi:uncharacterized protein YbjT (DUF2867 family)
MNVLVTGANGFVGAALIKRLLKSGHQITALVRSLDNVKTKKNDAITYVEGDLLHPKSLPKIGKIDKAYYLVHGLKSASADFEYEEAVAAVNFINWVRESRPEIIYLGGLAPHTEVLSSHLRSRVLTGAILGASGLAVIELRASIILGAGSLSFEMIKALSERLPFRPEFSLLEKPCQPLALDDLLNYLEKSLEVKVINHEIIEIGGPDVTTYGDLLELYAQLSGLKRKKIKLPEVEVKVLMKALDYAVPEHSQIGKKLTESLEHPTVVMDDKAKEFFSVVQPMKLKISMEKAIKNSESHYPPLWEKDFLKSLLSDKILTQSGLISPDLLKSLEKVGRLKDILSRK